MAIEKRRRPLAKAYVSFWKMAFGEGLMLLYRKNYFPAKPKEAFALAIAAFTFTNKIPSSRVAVQKQKTLFSRNERKHTSRNSNSRGANQ